MIEITYTQLYIFITLIWIIARLVAAIKSKTFSLKRELQLLLVYVCIVVISRFVYFGFHLEQTIAFGDSLNDLSMIQAAGTGVAVANAWDEVKSCADDVCPSNENDGIAHYLLDHFPSYF